MASHTVTELKQTSPGRYTVVFEGGDELRSTLNAITDLRLYPGKELDEEALRALRQASHVGLVREKALELLSHRPHSRKELQTKLTRRGEDEQSVRDCLDWLEQNGFLNDESYAAAVARSYARKGYGAGRVRQELSRRGIARELWDESLAEMGEHNDKLDSLIQKRLHDPEDRDEVRKLTASLLRRGFSWDEVKAALSRRCAVLEQEPFE